MILAGEMPDNKVNPEDLAPDLPEDATGDLPDDLPSYDQCMRKSLFKHIFNFEFFNSKPLKPRMTLLHHQNFHHLQIRSKKVKTTLADGQVQQSSGPVLH